MRNIVTRRDHFNPCGSLQRTFDLAPPPLALSFLSKSLRRVIPAVWPIRVKTCVGVDGVYRYWLRWYRRSSVLKSRAFALEPNSIAFLPRKRTSANPPRNTWNGRVIFFR